jgi:hypothetical protein
MEQTYDHMESTKCVLIDHKDLEICIHKLCSSGYKPTKQSMNHNNIMK